MVAWARCGGGAVRFGGEPVHVLPDRARARLRAHSFGFVFQDAALDATRTVLDNVVETALYRGQPRRLAVAEARRLMERFQVGLRATHKPGQISGDSPPGPRWAEPLRLARYCSVGYVVLA